MIAPIFVFVNGGFGGIEVLNAPYRVNASEIKATLRGGPDKPTHRRTLWTHVRPRPVPSRPVPTPQRSVSGPARLLPRNSHLRAGEPPHAASAFGLPRPPPRVTPRCCSPLPAAARRSRCAARPEAGLGGQEPGRDRGRKTIQKHCPPRRRIWLHINGKQRSSSFSLPPQTLSHVEVFFFLLPAPHIPAHCATRSDDVTGPGVGMSP